MANLASMIMEGSMYGFSRANLTHTYDHEDGACLIAMESAEALRDIFEAEFYIPNSCTIQAAMEGASCVEESSQAAIMEASIKGAFTKIKEFFIKLKEKVKELLHNLKRYLLGIFGNDEKWVNQYENELKALKSDQLKGYKIKMYKYTHLEIPTPLDVDKEISATQQAIDQIMLYNDKLDKDNFDEEKVNDHYEKEYNAVLKADKMDPDDDIDKQLWSYYRDDASNENAKEEIEVNPSFIKTCIDTIKKASKVVNDIDKYQSKTDNSYKKCIGLVDKIEGKVSKVNVTGDQEKSTVNASDLGMTWDSHKVNSESGSNEYLDHVLNNRMAANLSTVLRAFSSHISKKQTYDNKKITGLKTALNERNTAYKKALTGAFGYARKNGKKTK